MNKIGMFCFPNQRPFEFFVFFVSHPLPIDILIFSQETCVQFTHNFVAMLLW